MGRRRAEAHDYDGVAKDLQRDLSIVVATPVRPPEPVEPAAPLACRESKPVATKAKRYKVTQDEDVTLARFVLGLQEASGTKVNLALLNRVTNAIIMDAQEEILREIRTGTPLRQPSNNDTVAYADFENSWRRIVERAIRRRGARA
ncbi:MAG: hypothetical protein R3B46_15380 [Phycisphaerales bacterium]